MLWDSQEDYSSSSQSSCPPMSTSSFYSDDAYDTADIRTPPSSRRSSLDSVKLEGMSFSAADTPERHGTSNDMPSISSMHEMSPGFSGQSMLSPSSWAKLFPYQSSMGFNTFCSYDNENFGFLPSCDALPIGTPALEMDIISPISGMESSLGPMDFVDPSQTTFIGAFDVHSPMHLMNPLQFESPVSDNALDQNSPMANMTFYMQYEDCKSASTTSSRPPTTRQPIFEPVRTSAALQRTQAESQILRRARKRVQRQISGMIPRNIRIQHAPDKKCPWPRCDKEFKRSEHLKRHELTVHDHNQEIFPCQFCKHPFNRRDNLKSHLKLHADPLNAKRTDFFKEAQAAYDGIDRKKKKKKKTKTEG